MVERLGRLAGQDGSSRGFLDRVMDPATGELRLPRSGRIWEAVGGAHMSGSTGRGRLVAVIDAGFDLSVPALGHGLHPASRVRADTPPKPDVDWHGTAVALLVRTVAPDAELLLLDVWKPGGLRPHDVATALDAAREAGADVINLSLEFPTASTLRAGDWRDPAVLYASVPPVPAMLAQIDAALRDAEPYAEPRCPGACEICAALGRASESALVVAASGNDVTELACPACVRRVLGVGFRRTVAVEHQGVVFLRPAMTESILDVGRAELLVEEPPGFVGTSFAAPLVAGLGALLPTPGELLELSRLERAFNATVLVLAETQFSAGAEALPPGAPDALVRSLKHVYDLIPPEHRHPDQEWVTGPCAACSITMLDWYDVYVSTIIAVERPGEALPVARIAATLFPLTATVRSNAGLAAERTALSSPPDGDPNDRTLLLLEAYSGHSAAAHYAPQADMYAAARDRVRAELERVESAPP